MTEPNAWVFDLETYYDKEYSLRKMTPVEYILDPRFEAVGCAVKEGIAGTPYWVHGPDLPKFFAQVPRNIVAMSHNWLFDGCVLAWRYGYMPKMMSCTLSIARATLSHLLRSVSLASVARHFGLPPKGNEVHNVIGMSRAAIIAAGLYESYADYSKHDAELCGRLFDLMVRGGSFPLNELPILDAVLRCAVQPRFRLDSTLLCEHLAAIKARKDELLAQAMMAGADGKSTLMSGDAFAAMLSSLGVDPPTKISPRTGKQAWAFAKTDAAMIELEEHENPAVQALVAARLGHKSTIEETRTQRLINISLLQWPAHITNESNPGLMPVPLRFSGAHTHRLSGDWKLNMQNLPTRKGNTIRRALTAPFGHKVVVADASQIEARIVAWICGQSDLVAQFANGEDVYSLFASEIFGFVVVKTEHKGERFCGKTCILGLGYQTGWVKLQHTIKVQSKEQIGYTIELSDVEAQRYVNTYRRKYATVPAAWRLLGTRGIDVLANGGSFTFGPCIFERGAVLLPNGLRLHYPNLRQEEGQWVYDLAGEWHKLYGGALLENIVQALARIHTMDAAARIQKRVQPLDVRLNLQAHDELAYVVPDADVTQVQAVLSEEMARPPSWGRGLPLASEVGVGQTYGDAK